MAETAKIGAGKGSRLASDTKSMMSTLSNGANGCLRPMADPDPWFSGREAETDQIIDCLSKKRMRSVLLVGPAGVGKTQLARKAAQGMKDSMFFYELDVGSLMAGMIYVGSFEERFKDVISVIKRHNDLHKDRPIALFVDEAHTLWYADKNQFAGTLGIADMLKPYMSDGSIIVIGATTEEEFAENARKDKALLRRMSPVFVGEPCEKTVLEAMRGFCGEDSNIISDEEAKAVYAASKAINGGHNPDMSIEILDRYMARKKRTSRKSSWDYEKEISDIAEGIKKTMDLLAKAS